MTSKPHHSSTSIISKRFSNSRCEKAQCVSRAIRRGIFFSDANSRPQRGDLDIFPSSLALPARHLRAERASFISLLRDEIFVLAARTSLSKRLIAVLSPPLHTLSLFIVDERATATSPTITTNNVLYHHLLYIIVGVEERLASSC